MCDSCVLLHARPRPCVGNGHVGEERSSTFRQSLETADGYAHSKTAKLKLWQGGFYEHVLRAEEDRAAVIRYLLENPIRAGLVQELRQYPYWGSGLCSRDELIHNMYAQRARVRGG